MTESLIYLLSLTVQFPPLGFEYLNGIGARYLCCPRHNDPGRISQGKQVLGDGSY